MTARRPLAPLPRAVPPLLALALLALAPAPAAAQAIYPIDRAEILAGGRFDLRVEFPAGAAGEVSVTIDGRDAAQVLGRPATLTEAAGEGGVAAYVIRGAALPPGARAVEAARGGLRARVAWEVYATPERAAARNVILFVGDGLSIAHRTAARMLSKGIREGRYGGELAMDDMPRMALVSTAGSDSIVTDSANAMSAFATGHKTCVNAMGLYCSRAARDEHPRVETVAELVKRRTGKAVGVVTNTEIQDATPAAMVAHVRRRADYDPIVAAFFEARPEVIMGGGTPHFLPRSAPGSRRADEVDYLAKFQEAGYRYATTDGAMKAAAADPAVTRLLGLFHPRNLDGALDRRVLKRGTVAAHPEQPDLADQTRAALRVLSRNPEGFLLMVESGSIDKYSHALDWERAVYDTIMLDDAVKAAKDFAGDRNDTLIIVVPDHTHPVSIIGTYDDSAPDAPLRERLGTYDRARFPSYPPPDADGYPGAVDVPRRLAFVFGAAPDHCDTGRPFLAGPNVPTRPAEPVPAPTPGAGPAGGAAPAGAPAPGGGAPLAAAQVPRAVANEANCVPGSVRRSGNLPFGLPAGVHSADDGLLTAMGPGSEAFRGHLDNTRVFRAMASALALGGAP